MSKKLGIGIIGCGVIAAEYAKDLLNYDEVELIGVADIDSEKARTFASENDTQAYDSTEALLADEKVDIALNLTIHHAHTEVIRQCLNAGKHVFSEKPLSMTYADAKGLVDLADKKGLRLGCAPCTLMGEAQQTAWKLIRENKIGKVQVVYAEVNWGRIESWHPIPQPFYDVGPLFDVGVYPLTILVSMFGSAKRVQSYGKVIYPERQTKRGEPFQITTPDFGVTLIEMSDGTIIRLTTNFYVHSRTKQSGIEFHGQDGSIHLTTWHNFDATVEYAKFGDEYNAVPLVRDGTAGTPWGQGIWEMAVAIRENRPHRFTGQLAAHIVDILESSAKSMQEGRPIEINSTCETPAPMEWAK